MPVDPVTYALGHSPDHLVCPPWWRGALQTGTALCPAVLGTQIFTGKYHHNKK